MAEGVTYADLRFAKSPPRGKCCAPPGQDAHEECSDGELTYENCPTAGGRPRGHNPPSPQVPPPAPGPAWRRIWSRVSLALLGACLFLLAAGLGLGIRYWQVSRQLEGASQRHESESSALAERIGSLEGDQTHYRGQLSQAEAELSATQQALGQCWQAGNRTQQQLEEQLSLLQQEKNKTSQELEKARSCQQRGCCPAGWRLFRWKCLWVSSEKMTWEESNQACQRQKAQLLILKPWDAGTIWDATEITGDLQSEEFWIGLYAAWTHYKWRWFWVDSSYYSGTDTLPSLRGYNEYEACITLKRRQLSLGTCIRTHQYVCEKAASPGGPG